MQSKNIIKLMNTIYAEPTPTEFLAMVAHDLKSPINAEILALKQLRNIEDMSKRTELINEIIGAANYMKNLVDNILGKYKLETGILTLRRSDFCLKSLVSECIDETRCLLDSKTVVFDCKLKNVNINADYFEIKRVVYNLLVNAAEHAKKDTKIEIKLHKKWGNFTLSIKNYGRGIENPEEIFNQNFSKRGSTGLGLYISKRVINAHDGTINAKSRGKWARLSFTLPAYQH